MLARRFLVTSCVGCLWCVTQSQNAVAKNQQSLIISHGSVCCLGTPLTWAWVAVLSLPGSHVSWSASDLAGAGPLTGIWYQFQWVREGFLTAPSNSQTPLGALWFNSILTLPTWGQHQPLQMPIANPDCYLCFSLPSYKSKVPVTPSKQDIRSKSMVSPLLLMDWL